MKFTTLSLLIIIASAISAQQSSPNAEDIFQRYFQQAKIFSSAYPQEKVHLHFDNTSYYAGDTIWFKAYVTQGTENRPTTLSQPLYVELLDQLGHIIDKQIIKTQKGEGQGQFILEKSGLSGYYEIRAFTKWMLAFGDEYYFSRTFPVYRPRIGINDEERFIATYDMSPSMKQRPKSNVKKLSVRFFPEGGQLIEGVTSIVAFKAESKKEGAVNVSGILRTKKGEKLTEFRTVHDGMGCLSYTPQTGIEVEAEVEYNGEKYKYSLPKALPQGYVLNVTNREKTFDIRILCNGITDSDTLALFISHQNIPLVWHALTFEKKQAELIRIPTDKLPAGIIQFSLMNRKANVLAERYCYIMPNSFLQLTAQTNNSYYYPFTPIHCKIEAKDSNGQPIETNLSVSVRSTLQYDNTIFTDLLLTSELKGYIHQPGYYFAENSKQRKQELDILTLVHGWKKYNLEDMISNPPIQPRYLPEDKLTIHGQLKSYILKKNKENLEVSILSKKEGIFMAGKSISDSLGRFQIPVEDFEGTTEAVIQTRKVGKERNKDASILIDRNFSPAPRAYGYKELHPEWKDLTHWQQKAENFDSLYMDSIRKVEGLYVLDEVEIKSKRRQGSNMATKINEKSIDAYYDVRRSVDLLRDNGKIVTTIPELMEKLSPQFDWDRSNDKLTYRQKPICYIMDNHILSETETQMMLTEVDGLASIIISKGTGGINDEIIQNTKMSEVTDSTGVDISKLDKYSVFYLIPLPRRDVLNKSQTAVLGTRQTVIQGYTHALEYYSPTYPTKELYMDKVDKRRTLYWNPSVRTDENGKAVIECYNNQYSTPVIIQAETMSKDGQIGSMKYSTIGQAEQ